MVQFLPADLRTQRMHWLLDLTWDGQVYRLSEGPLTAVIDGETLEYGDGLVFDGAVEDALDLFASSPTERTISLTMHLAEMVDVPAMIEAGHDLGAATATLRLWVEGATEARAILSGGVRGVRYGGREEPVDLTIEEIPLLAPGRIPSDTQRINPGDSTIAAQNAELPGQFYPTIFGRPGGDAGYGSPALFFLMIPAATTGTATIAAHPCVSGDVSVVNENTGLAEVVTPAWNPGRRGTEIAPTTMPENAGETSSSYYIRWPSSGGAGVPSPSNPAAPMRGAGEIIQWLAERSGARIDAGRLRSAVPLLASFRLDAAIVPGKEERVSPLEWIEEHLVQILPVSARVSDEGLYYAVWKWDALAVDAVAHLDADALRCERVGQVEYSDPDGTYQTIRLDYALDYSTDAHTATLIYTGDESLTSDEIEIVTDPYLRASFRRHSGDDPARARTMELASDVILDSATAHLVCRGLARRHALQSRLVRYEADPEFGWLEPGMVVTLTDADLSLAGAVAAVEMVLRGTEPRVGLSLRLPGSIGLRGG